MRSKQLLILFLLLVAPVASAEYDFCELKTAEQCVDGPGEKIIGGVKVFKNCWRYERTYDCYKPPVSNDCTAEEAALERLELLEIIEKTNSNKLVKWRESKDSSKSCEMPAGYTCTDWYTTESGRDAKSCIPTTKDTCEPDNCSIVTQECTSYINGLCAQESIKYTCGSSGACDPDSGIDITGDESVGFEDAIAAASITDLIASAGKVDETTGEIRLFGGDSSSCKFVTDEWKTSLAVTGTATVTASIIFGGAFGAMASSPISSIVIATLDGKFNCCKSNPDSVDVTGSFNYCTDDDVQLAVARMTKRSVELGDKMKSGCFCSDLAGLITLVPHRYGTSEIHDCDDLCGNPYLAIYGKKNTLQHSRHYCVFDDMLSRIIQEEGRKQIEEILNSSQSTDRVAVDFNGNYYGVPGWVSAQSANGNLLSVYRWDSECLNFEGQFDAATGERFCPNGPEVYVAACSLKKQADCGVLPTNPRNNKSNWDVVGITATGIDNSLTINPFVQISGECFNDNNCSFMFNTWPAGLGSTIVQKSELIWQQKFPIDLGGTDPYSWAVFQGGTNSYQVQMLTAVKQNAEPAAPTIRVAKVGGANWKSFELPNPTPPGNFSVTLDDGTKLFLSGQCNQLYCHYTFAVNVTLKLKPWYTDVDGGSKSYCLLDSPFGCIDSTREHRIDKRVAHCEGFTIDEFMALNLSEMDLSDYMDSLTERAKNAMLKIIQETADE